MATTADKVGKIAIRLNEPTVDEPTRSEILRPKWPKPRYNDLDLGKYAADLIVIPIEK